MIKTWHFSDVYITEALLMTQLLQGGIIMKKNAIISILSSAMIITSAAASVYVSAAQIALVPSPVSDVQMTIASTVPIYPVDPFGYEE